MKTETKMHADIAKIMVSKYSGKALTLHLFDLFWIFGTTFGSPSTTGVIPDYR